MDRRAIDWRIETGRLVRVYPGVYALAGAEGGNRAELVEACLFGGDRSILSRRGAAQCYELGYFGQIDVSVPSTRAARGRVVFHRDEIADSDWIERDGLRVTTPARTVLDLCATVPWPRMRRLFNEAEVQQLVDLPAIRQVLSRHPRRRGTPALRRLAGLELEASDGVIRSRLEGRFRRFLARRGYPRPQSNVLIEVGGDVYEADFLWRRSRVIVEVDGRSTHDTVERFESDRERDRCLSAHGWHPVRVTDRALRAPGRLARDLDLLLAGERGSEMRSA